MIAMLGDMVEGCDIFPSQNSGLRMSAREQVDRMFPILLRLIKELQKKYRKTQVSVQYVYGNHGRTSKSCGLDNNWDLQLYSQVLPQQRPMHTYQAKVVQVGEHKVLMQHRAELDGTSTKPYRKIGEDTYMCLPHMARKIDGRLAFYNSDLLIAGHWHQGQSYVWDGAVRYVSNGALCGPTPHSDALGCYDDPKQAYVELDKSVRVHWLTW